MLECERRGCELDGLSLADFTAQSDLFEEDIVRMLDLDAIVDARLTYGGTGRAAVKTQFEEAQQRLAADEERI